MRTEKSTEMEKTGVKVTTIALQSGTQAFGLFYEKYSFSNAWQRALEFVLDYGKTITFGGKVKGKQQYEKKLAKDADVTIVLEKNALDEALRGVLHPQFPTKEKHKEAYLKEWDRGYDWRKQGFTYCYEDRAEAYEGTVWTLDHRSQTLIDQWAFAKEDVALQIETGIQSNRNVIDIGNPSIDRYEIPDSPPCLRDIWIRWEGDDRLSVKALWRSRDLFAAWPVNIYGLLNAVKREVADPNHCRIVQYTDKNHSLHICHYDQEDAAKVKPVQVSPQFLRT